VEKKDGMMTTVLALLVPALLLAYYLKAARSSAHASRLLVGLLVVGTCLFYIGILLTRISLGLGTMLQLIGACLFFTGVAFHTLKRPTAQPPVSSEDEADPTPAGE
jgi:heme A synthase